MIHRIDWSSPKYIKQYLVHFKISEKRSLSKFLKVLQYSIHLTNYRRMWLAVSTKSWNTSCITLRLIIKIQNKITIDYDLLYFILYNDIKTLILSRYHLNPHVLLFPIKYFSLRVLSQILTKIPILIHSFVFSEFLH